MGKLRKGNRKNRRGEGKKLQVLPGKSPTNRTKIGEKKGQGADRIFLSCRVARRGARAKTVKKRKRETGCESTEI